MARTPQEIVNSEVLCCMSSLVATLSQAYGDHDSSATGTDLQNLAEQAFELACPIDDWEEAIIQAGWTIEGNHFVSPDDPTIRHDNAQRACEANDIEPYQREVFEHWAVTDWFADQLEAHGEKVDKDFAGLCIWARTTTGQAIYADGVIEAIAADLAKAG